MIMIDARAKLCLRSKKRSGFLQTIARWFACFLSCLLGCSVLACLLVQYPGRLNGRQAAPERDQSRIGSGGGSVQPARIACRLHPRWIVSRSIAAAHIGAPLYLLRQRWLLKRLLLRLRLLLQQQQRRWLLQWWLLRLLPAARPLVEFRQDGPELVADFGKARSFVGILVPAPLHQVPEHDRHADAPGAGIQLHGGPGPEGLFRVADLGRRQKAAPGALKDLPHANPVRIHVGRQSVREALDDLGGHGPHRPDQSRHLVGVVVIVASSALGGSGSGGAVFAAVRGIPARLPRAFGSGTGGTGRSRRHPVPWFALLGQSVIKDLHPLLQIPGSIVIGMGMGMGIVIVVGIAVANRGHRRQSFPAHVLGFQVAKDNLVVVQVPHALRDVKESQDAFSQQHQRVRGTRGYYGGAIGRW
mmetsp:Transcript_4750/g.11560  ORF Transcript_4750/g.11560 Transcript_4750/m.11560 type:complete len:415 (+) Transcript_4750:60-1304(+)